MRISKINRTFFDKIVFIWTGRRKWIEVKNKKTERDNKTHKYSNMYKYTKIHIQVTRFSILVNFFFIRSVNSVFYGDDRRSLLWLLDASTQNFLFIHAHFESNAINEEDLYYLHHFLINSVFRLHDKKDFFDALNICCCVLRVNRFSTWFLWNTIF